MLYQCPAQTDAGDLSKLRIACERDRRRRKLLARPAQFVEPKGSNIVVSPTGESQFLNEPRSSFRRQCDRMVGIPVGRQCHRWNRGEIRQLVCWNRNLQEIEVEVSSGDSVVGGRDGMLYASAE